MTNPRNRDLASAQEGRESVEALRLLDRLLTPPSPAMAHDTAAQQLQLVVSAYAADRRSDVERGVRSPEEAAELLHEYGWGIVDAAGLIYRSRATSEAVQSFLERKVLELHPGWRGDSATTKCPRPAAPFDD